MLGETEGTSEGAELGTSLGELDGTSEGTELGVSDGVDVGM